MFGFGKRKTIVLPDSYKDLIDAKNYTVFLEKCLMTLKNLDYEVLSSKDGDITYTNSEGNEAHFFLDNLLRKYLQSDDKDKEILEHFSKLKDQTVAYNYLYKDFEYARQFLKILIKADDIIPNIEAFVHLKKLPGLAVILILDFEEQFHFVQTVKASEWNISEEELFKIALENIKEETIEVKEYQYEDKFTVYILFSGDFSASSTLIIPEKFDYAIGEYGCLIALPTKGTVLLHPISTTDVLDLVITLYPTVENFFNEDPSNVTLDFYWFFNDFYYVFKKEVNEDGTITIGLPKELKELFDKVSE